MEYRQLGNCGLKVSAIGLGTNTFSLKVDEAGSLAIINRALELGVNYIDTADVYGRGGSETLLGKALKGRRSQFVVATKFGKVMGDKPNQRGASRYYIQAEVEASLRRLQTDYIDLYQIHEPDPETPIEETLRALDDLVRAGKVRYLGTSNFSAWQLCDAVWTARMYNLNTLVTEQSRYNLLDRQIEAELVPFCRAHKIGIIPWGPLAGGFLTGKYRKGEKVSSEWRLDDQARVRGKAFYGSLFSESNWEKLAGLDAFARKRGHTIGELAIAWLLAKPWVATVITGARQAEQVSANAAAGEWKLSAEEVGEVDRLSEANRL
jgi:aryl-alcohol dehydrogenase-like predicted oxidoreductase